MGVTVLVSFLALSAMVGNQFSLRSLKDVSFEKIQTQKEGPQIFMVFQEGCTACLTQVTYFKCLDVPVTLLGAFSTEKALRKEYQKMRTQYPGYLATKDILTNLSVGQELTPQTVLMTAKKKILFQGITECKTIKQYLVGQSG